MSISASEVPLNIVHIGDISYARGFCLLGVLHESNSSFCIESALHGWYWKSRIRLAYTAVLSPIDLITIKTVEVK